MHEAKEIIDTLTLDGAARAIGVEARSVKHARWRGKLPSAWYAAIWEECAARGLGEPSFDAFTFRRASSYADNDRQASLLNTIEGEG